MTSGPIHNAVRRMTELIDLENLEGYFDEYLLESTSAHDERDEDDFDTLSMEKDCSSPHTARPPSTRLITIESYTKICIERGVNDKSNEKQQIPSKNKSEENKKVRRERRDSIDLTDVVRKQRASRTSRVSHLDKNAWKDFGRKEKKDHYDRENRSKISWILKLFCGVNQEFKWYSLKGKGVCLILPMTIFYLILCVVLLPFILVAAFVSALVLGAGVCSYLSLATKKVGVSSDDDSDKSCLEAIWWWA